MNHPPAAQQRPPAVPGSRPSPEGEQNPSDQGQTAAVPPLAAPFAHRVKLVFRLPRPDQDAAVALQLLSAQDWTADVTVGTGPRQNGAPTLYTVEVRLDGARRIAVTVAKRRILTLMTRAHVTIEIVQAALVTPAPTPPTSTWHAYLIPPWARRDRGVRPQLASAWVRAGFADIQQTVTLRGPGSPEDAAAAFAEHDLGTPFDPEIHAVRRQLGPRVASSEEPADRWWHDRRGTALLGATSLAVVGYGWALHAVPWPWRIVMLVPLAVAAWFCGEWITPGRSHPRLLAALAGAVIVGTFAFLGFTAASRMDSRGVLVALLQVAALAAVLRGCWHALRRTWFSRNFVGLLSVLVSLPIVMPFLGRFLQSLYLNDTFDIPVDVLAVSTYWTYAAAAKPVAIGGAVLLSSIALMGWARYWNWAGDHVALSVMVVVLALPSTVVALATAMDNASGAASRAASAVTAGRSPRAFFGIGGQRVCVQPTTAHPTVANGPLPTDHPLLTFPTSGSELWLWDPRRATGSRHAYAALHLPADQAATVAVPDGVNSCRKR